MKRYVEIDIAKGIGIILVILGHALNAEQRAVDIPNATRTFNFIYSFHMPLFILLAGFTLGLSVYKKKKTTLIISRLKRLMIPYVVAGLVYFLLKTAITKLKHLELPEANNLWKMIIGINPSFSLWFLYVLFILSVLAILIVRKKNICFLVIVSAVITIFCSNSLFKDKEILMSLENICRLIFYFFIGIMIATYYGKIKKWLYKWYLQLISVAVFVVGYILQYKIKNTFLKNTDCLLVAFSAIILTLFISNCLSQIDNKFSKGIKSIGLYSMDIYIIGSLIQPMLKILFGEGEGIKYWVYVVGSTIIVIAVSMLLSKFVIRKVKIFRRLLLGLD